MNRNTSLKIGNYPTLLDFCSKMLVKLPEELTDRKVNLSRVEILRLDDNDLARVEAHEVWERLVKLKEVGLSKNNLVFLDPRVCASWKSVSCLRIFDNKLSK